MKSLPDFNTQIRQAWLAEMQPKLATSPAQPEHKSDFEKSIAWRGVFVAALIVIGVNLLPPPSAGDVHATARAFV